MQYFHPHIIKKVSQITEQSKTSVQGGSQEAPKMDPEIDKNGDLRLKVSIGCPCGPNTKMITQGAKNGDSGT